MENHNHSVHHDHSAHHDHQEHHNHQEHLPMINLTEGNNISSDHHATGHEAHHASQHNHGSMLMFFHFGCEEVVLFDWWRINSCAGLLLSCVLVFLMAAAYECIKWFRIYYQMCSSAQRVRTGVTLNEVTAGVEETLIQNNAPAKTNARSGATLPNDQVYAPTVFASAGTQRPNSKADSLRESFQEGVRCCAIKFSTYLRVFEAILYGLQLVIAYFLMLIAMTYNIWLFTAVVLGATVGHWLFAGLKCFFTPVTPLLSHDRADNFASDACH